jgi:TolB protein
LLLLGIAGARGAEPDWVRLTTDGNFKQRPAWSPDGQQLVYAQHIGARIELMLIDADGSHPRRLTDREHPEYDASWSPDGKRLAFTFVRVTPGQGDLDVYTIAADGTDLHPVATTGPQLSHEESPAWSPDGTRIAYTSTRDGNQELYVADVDGARAMRVTHDPAIDAHPAWSPDGRKLAFATARWGDLEIAVMDPDGSNLVRLTESRGLDDYPAWSPDGRQLAFTSNRDGNFEIYLSDADGGHPRNVTRSPALENFAAWSPAGKLTFVSNRDGGFDLYRSER